MTLKLALIIDGDPAGAKKALAETGAAVEELGKKTDAANKIGERQKSIWGDTAGKAGEAAKSVGELADSSGKLAPALDDVAAGAGKAAPEIEKAGTAAGGASGGFSGLKMNVAAIAVSFAAGLGTGLIVSGFEKALEAGIKFAQGVLTDGPRIEADLKSHAELIGNIKKAYAEAEGAASSYGNLSGSLLKFQAQQDKGRLERDLKDSLPSSRELDPPNPTFNFSDPAGPARGALDKIKAALNSGKADIIAYRTELAKIGTDLPAGSPLRAWIENQLDMTEPASKLQEELSRVKDVLSGLDGDAQAAATALGGAAEKYGAISESAGAAAPNLNATASGITNTGTAASTATGQLNAYAQALKNASGGVSLPTIPSGPQVPTGYAAGGYTGDFDPSAAVGVVHGREYVFDAASTSRIGVGTLEAMRRGVKGYAEGGFVGQMSAGASGAVAIPAGGVLVGASADELNRLQAALNGVADAARDGEEDVDSFSDRFEEGLKELGQSLLDTFLNTIKSELTKALEGAFSGGGSGGGGGFGGILSSLFGGLFGGGADFLDGGSTFLGTWDSGGWTGPGGKFDPAGIVHKDEFVFNKEETNAIGVSNLKALASASKSGFSGGGYTSGSVTGSGMKFAPSAPQIVFNNMGTAQKVVEQREEDDGQGGRRTVFVLDDAIASNIGRAGSASGKAMRTAFGQQRKTVMR